MFQAFSVLDRRFFGVARAGTLRVGKKNLLIGIKLKMEFQLKFT